MTKLSLLPVNTGKCERTNGLEGINAASTKGERRTLSCGGGTCDLERDVAVSLAQAFDGGSLQYMVMNDGTNADIAVKPVGDEDWLPLQLKTTQKCVSGCSSMQFKECRGYTCLLLCWNCGAERGVLLDGVGVGKACEGSANLNFTFASIVSKPYFVSLVDRSSIADVFSQYLLRDPPRYSETFLRWQLASKDHVLEFIGAFYMMSVLGCRLSESQNSHVDLLDISGCRRQLKSAWRRDGTVGLIFNLATSIGHGTGGKVLKGAYPLSEDGLPPFDFLDVFFVESGLLHHWMLPVEGLLAGSNAITYKNQAAGTFVQKFPSVFSSIDSATGKRIGGCMNGRVYFPDSPGLAMRCERCWVLKDTYYQGCAPISTFINADLIEEMPSETQAVIKQLIVR